MAADKSDEQGVLGNLPRSRPGVRSNKRRSGSGGAGASSSIASAGPAETSSERRPKAAHPKTSARTGAAKPTPKPKAKAKAKTAAKRAAAKPTEATRPKPRAGERPPAPEATRPKPRAGERPPAPEATRPSTERHDPLSEAVRLAGKVAETGLKTVGGIIRRLPGR